MHIVTKTIKYEDSFENSFSLHETLKEAQQEVEAYKIDNNLYYASISEVVESYDSFEQPQVSIEEKIRQTENWLALNERQLCLPSMPSEAEIQKLEVSHKKEMLFILKELQKLNNEKNN